ncbi:MAG: hypothetical protein ACI93R_003616 [Flavobacteriales bacterium]|jgi:hypothetical protein
MSAPAVGSVDHLSGHILEITFSDDFKQVVDFSLFIFSNGHPDYDQYKKVEKFLTYEVVDGNLNWDDYTMIFPVEDLYKNTLIKNR